MLRELLANLEAMMLKLTPTVEPWLGDILLDEDRKMKVDDVTQIKLAGGPVYVGHYVSHTDTHLTLKLWGTNAVVTFAYRQFEYMLEYDNHSGFMVEVELD
jgi:hypothetical protein